MIEIKEIENGVFSVCLTAQDYNQLDGISKTLDVRAEQILQDAIECNLNLLAHLLKN